MPNVTCLTLYPSQELEAALCREATCFLQADAQEFAHQVGLFLTSGLSVKAYDELVFGSAEDYHTTQDRQEGGPADGATGSAGGAAAYAGLDGGDAGGSAGAGRDSGVAGSRRVSGTDVINLVDSDTDGGGDDFGYEEYSDE